MEQFRASQGEGMPGIPEAAMKYRIARGQFITAIAVAEMEGSIKHLWAKLEPLVKPEERKKAFSLLSVGLVTAWKRGHDADKVDQPTERRAT